MTKTLDLKIVNSGMEGTFVVFQTYSDGTRTSFYSSCPEQDVEIIKAQNKGVRTVTVNDQRH